MQEVRGSNPRSSTAGQRPLPRLPGEGLACFEGQDRYQGCYWAYGLILMRDRPKILAG
jgi:hypothetical protein